MIATLGVAMAAGLTLEDSVRLANTAASLVVEQVGTTSVSIEQLEQKLFAVGQSEQPISAGSL